MILRESGTIFAAMSEIISGSEMFLCFLKYAGDL